MGNRIMRCWMSDPQVYEIDVNKKYILRMDSEIPLNPAVVERIVADIDEWLKGDRPVLFLYGLGDVKLVRVVEAEVDDE